MSSSELDTLQKAFREAGGKWSTFVIWAKNTFTLGRSDYQRQYEPILYGWKQGADHYWCGDRDQGDVWFFDKSAKNGLHPTMKPVALVERAIRNSSKSRDIVLDPFGGSGTTLIAAERTGRRARLIELDPKYADVIVQHWQEQTGRASGSPRICGRAAITSTRPSPNTCPPATGDTPAGRSSASARRRTPDRTGDGGALRTDPRTTSGSRTGLSRLSRHCSAGRSLRRRAFGAAAERAIEGAAGQGHLLRRAGRPVRLTREGDPALRGARGGRRQLLRSAELRQKGVVFPKRGHFQFDARPRCGRSCLLQP